MFVTIDPEDESAEGRAGECLIWIEDDGPGIPEAERIRIFDRGARLDTGKPGTGLGLAIVRDVAEIYGGSVTLGTNGAAPTWQMVVDLVREVEIDNVDASSAAFLTNAQVKSRLARTPRQTSGIEGNFILQPPFSDLYGYPLSVSQQVPSNLSKGTGSNLSALIFGVWSDLVIGQWSGIDLMVDPYTGSSAATVRVTAFHDCDFAVRYPESFAECNEIITT